MQTSEQLRAARAMLKIDQLTLAERSGVSVETIKRFESGKGKIKGRSDTIESLRRTLEFMGIEFIEPEAASRLDFRVDRHTGAGVRFATNPHEKYIKLVAEVTGQAAGLVLNMELDRDPELFQKGPTHVTKVLMRDLQDWLDRLMKTRYPAKAP